jgi:hypothetical protein
VELRGSEGLIENEVFTVILRASQWLLSRQLVNIARNNKLVILLSVIIVTQCTESRCRRW